MIRLKYFASLRDALDCDDEQIELQAGVDSVQALRDHLACRGDNWAKLILDGCVLTAVNQEVATPNTPICDGDEVAFFPPVTGG